MMTLRDHLLDLIFARHCLGCDRALYAPRRGHLCRACAEELSLYSLDRDEEHEPQRACWEYGGPVAQAICRAKYGDDLIVLRQLAELASPWFGVVLRQLERHEGMRATIVPTPMHRRDLRRRGFNQAAQLAAIWARQHGRGVSYGLVRKVRSTAAQASLGARARRENVHEVFAPGRHCARRLEGRLVVLVDDVITTGATLESLASICHRAGARRVVGLALAKRTLVDAEGGKGGGFFATGREINDPQDAVGTGGNDDAKVKIWG